MDFGNYAHPSLTRNAAEVLLMPLSTPHLLEALDSVISVPIVPFKGDNIALARNFNTHWRLIGSGEMV